jgi:type III secretion protein S
METTQITYLTSQALMLVLELSAPTIIVASIVGVAVGLVQALTQIQEQTLQFALKLAAVGFTIFLTASWTGHKLYVYCLNIFDSFPRLVR